MSDLRLPKLIIAFTVLALIASACGSPAPSSTDQISTAVAQTVQAQDSLTEVANIPTFTPVPSVETAIPDITATNTSAPSVGNPGCTVSALLTAETPPDYTLMKPGEYFWKTWTLKNTGTCIWDKAYQLIFTSGDLMGGLISYPLPEPVMPEASTNISIYLKAPDTVGTFKGDWLIQTPWGESFGILGKSPFYVQIVVSDEQKPKYGITRVTYQLVRDPESGCPTNVRYTVYATIEVNGPYEFEYYWDQSDGNESGPKTMEFTKAGSQTIDRMWMVGKGDSPNPRWMQIIVTAPRQQEYEKFIFLNNCP